MLHKAIVFSGMPEYWVKGHFAEKMLHHGIEVVRVATPEQAKSTTAEGVDLFVALVDMMSQGQKSQIREAAKSNNKKFVAVTRAQSDWDKLLGVTTKDEPLDVLFSNFPKELNEGTIRKLRAYGMKVAATFNLSSRPDLSKFRNVLCLFEMGGHGDVDGLRQHCDKYNKRLIRLSRKEASWQEELGSRKEEGGSMPYKFAVQDKDLSAFLQRYMELAQAGRDEDSMVPELGTYWSMGELRNGVQLNSCVNRIVRHERCPAFFKEWWEGRRKRVREQVSSPSLPPDPAPPSAPVQEVKEEEPRLPLDIAGVAEELRQELELYKKEHDQKCEEVARLTQALEEKSRELYTSNYASDLREKKAAFALQGLKEQVANQQKIIQDLETNLASANRELSSRSANSTGSYKKFFEVKASLQNLVDAGVLTEDEAVQRFWNYKPKEGV